MPHMRQIHLPHFLTNSNTYLRMKGKLADHGCVALHPVASCHYKHLKPLSCGFMHVLIGTAMLLYVRGIL